jgi:UPF0716 family protein affecting phage T7 exclusion
LSNRGSIGGLNLPIIIAVLGILGLFEPLLLLVFFAVLGYFLYRLEKRVANLEPQQPSDEGRPPKKPK